MRAVLTEAPGKAGHCRHCRGTLALPLGRLGMPRPTSRFLPLSPVPWA